MKLIIKMNQRLQDKRFQLNYIKATVSVYLSVWAVPGRFFHSLLVPCGTSANVTHFREKRNQGQFDFLKQKIW
jgi:hypothetical protein